MTITVENVVKTGTNGTGTVFSPSAYSNGGTDRVVLALITLTASGAVAPNVNSITSSGLTWARRAEASMFDGTSSQKTEIWWAYAASQLTSHSITMNHDSSSTFAVTLMSCAGCNTPSSPWDSNATVPASATNTSTSTSTSPAVSGIDENNTAPMFVWLQSTRAVSFSQTVPTGFTANGVNNQEPGSGSNRSYQQTGYKIDIGPLTAQAFTGGPSETQWTVICDVLAGGTSGPPEEDLVAHFTDDSALNAVITICLAVAFTDDSVFSAAITQEQNLVAHFTDDTVFNAVVQLDLIVHFTDDTVFNARIFKRPVLQSYLIVTG
jgi:hypothetical protein